MSPFDEYANKYKTARMERRNGVLQVTLHTRANRCAGGFCRTASCGSLSRHRHGPRNRVVILTGRAASFPAACDPGTSSFPTRPSIERIDRIHWEGRHLLMNLLNIEIPVISAINGSGVAATPRSPAVRHRPGGRDRAIPGFRALHVGRRAGRRHAHRLSAALGHESRTLFLDDRADARRRRSVATRTRR